MYPFQGRSIISKVPPSQAFQTFLMEEGIVEERALLGALGEQYRAYMRRTKRLIPFIY